jgi:hypothetical protein
MSRNSLDSAKVDYDNARRVRFFFVLNCILMSAYLTDQISTVLAYSNWMGWKPILASHNQASIAALYQLLSNLLPRSSEPRIHLRYPYCFLRQHIRVLILRQLRQSTRGAAVCSNAVMADAASSGGGEGAEVGSLGMVGRGSRGRGRGSRGRGRGRGAGGDAAGGEGAAAAAGDGGGVDFAGDGPGSYGRAGAAARDGGGHRRSRILAAGAAARAVFAGAAFHDREEPGEAERGDADGHDSQGGDADGGDADGHDGYDGRVAGHVAGTEWYRVLPGTTREESGGAMETDSVTGPSSSREKSGGPASPVHDCAAASGTGPDPRPPRRAVPSAAQRAKPAARPVAPAGGRRRKGAGDEGGPEAGLEDEGVDGADRGDGVRAAKAEAGPVGSRERAGRQRDAVVGEMAAWYPALVPRRHLPVHVRDPGRGPEDACGVLAVGSRAGLSVWAVHPLHPPQPEDRPAAGGDVGYAQLAAVAGFGPGTEGLDCLAWVTWHAARAGGLHEVWCWDMTLE